MIRKKKQCKEWGHWSPQRPLGKEHGLQEVLCWATVHRDSYLLVSFVCPSQEILRSKLRNLLIGETLPF